MTAIYGDDMDNRLIIVEGPDKVGKTTMINKLARVLSEGGFNVHRLKFSSPTSVDETEQYDEQRKKFFDSYDTCERILQDKNAIIIMDRSYVGEYVYAQIYNRLFPYYMAELHNKFKSLDPLYILITGTPVMNNTTTQDEYLRIYYDDVVKMFEEFFTEYVPHRVMLFKNEHFKTLDERDDYIVKSVCTNKCQAIKTTGNEYAATYITPHISELPLTMYHPFWEYQLKISLIPETPVIEPTHLDSFKYALFGEAPGYKGCGITHIPFYYDNSGMLLRNIFIQLGINIDTMFVSNVFHSTPPRNKLYNYISKDFLQLIEFNDIDGSDIPYWLKLEMKMFKSDVEFALQRTDVFIAVGRTAERCLKQLRAQCKYKYTIIFIYHPAYYLYKKMSSLCCDNYYKTLRQYMKLRRPDSTLFKSI